MSSQPRLFAALSWLRASLPSASRPAAAAARLEPPPDPSAPQAQQGTASEGSGQGTLPSPVGTPRSKPNRGYTIPDKPFILDPLL